LQNKWRIEQDFESVITQGKNSFENLKYSHIFLTGGTGFIGRWILEVINYYNTNNQTKIKVTILTRSPEKFKIEYPFLYNNLNYKFISGDIQSINEELLINSSDYTHLIHAATDASAELNEADPLKMFNTIVNGTKQILDFALRNQIKKILFLSSGAVYGQQSAETDFVSEMANSAPDCLNPKNTYAEAKRAAEMICAVYIKQFGCSIVIARIFALLGPMLNLNIHFAAGNFIRDALAQKKITILGNGLPIRSYMYPSDLIVWLLCLLTHGRSGLAYNVGSEEAISIVDLANLVSNIIGTRKYEIKNLTDTGWHFGRYVPSTKLIRDEFSLVNTIDISGSIIRTAYWNGWKGV